MRSPASQIFAHIHLIAPASWKTCINIKILMVLTNLCLEPKWLRMHWHQLNHFFCCTGVVRHGYMFPTVALPPNNQNHDCQEAHSERTLRLCELLLGLNTISTFFFGSATDRAMLFLLFVKSREWHTNRKAGVPAIVFSRAFQSIVSRLLVQLGKGSLSLSPP